MTVSLAVNNERPKGVALGSKYTGPDAFARQSTGEYWAVMQPLDPDEVKWQQFLLERSEA